MRIVPNLSDSKQNPPEIRLKSKINDTNCIYMNDFMTFNFEFCYFTICPLMGFA